MDLDSLIQELRTRMTFKDHTRPGDLILIATAAGCGYGLVQTIEPDSKKGWFQLRFVLLSVPPATVTWILRPPQMEGELFTMNGTEHKILPVALDTPPQEPTRPRGGLRLVTPPA